MIDILMATYNGEKYINTQIASIIHQIFTDWILYIHDDGSTDNTIKIIHKWAENDSRIRIINDNKKHLDSGKNFLYLLQYSTREYVCFCDQDDYWFENKLSIQYEAIKNIEMNIPVAVISEFWTWKYPENKIAEEIGRNNSDKINEFLFLNGGFQGCSTIFNARMRECLLSGFKYIWMHDHIMSLIALTIGKIIFLDKKLILYRQHLSNVTPSLPQNKKELIKTILNNYNIPVVYL